VVSALVLVDSGGFAGPTLRSRAFCAAMSRPWFLRAIYPWFAARYLHARDGAALRIRDAAVDAARRPGTTEILSALWGSFSGPEHDLRAAAMIPGARLIVLDAGHVPFADRPEAFLAAVLPFLEPTRHRAPHRSERDG
jgi:pimeloyl-ACP methyl ester carboxylesterase